MRLNRNFISIPWSYKTPKKKIDYLNKQSKKNLKERDMYRPPAVVYAVYEGLILSRLKEEVKKNKDSWQDFIKEVFPDKSLRTSARYIALARNFDVWKYPIFIVLGLSRLYELVTLLEGSSIFDEFDSYDIDIENGFRDETWVEDFQDAIDLLIMDLRSEHRMRREFGH